MAHPLKLIIQETQQELEKLLKAQATISSKEYLKMLYWLRLTRATVVKYWQTYSSVSSLHLGYAFEL